MADQVPPEFWEMMAEFIDKANALSQKHHPDLVGTALMYAGARFNTYVVARSANSIEDYANDHQKALDFYSDRFQNMFEQNFQDHLDNFNQYMKIKAG